MNTISDLFKFQSDFSQGGIARFLLALLLSLIFGLVLASIYRVYYRSNEAQDGSISRSFPLMSPAVTMIFWLIQFSLPLSLGLLGALSFVRFRTPIKRAEDIAFILILIAGALAAAVGHFINMTVLLILVATYGIARNQFPHINFEKDNFAILTIHSSKKDLTKNTEEVLKKFIKNITLVSSTSQDDINSMVFNLSKFSKDKSNELIENIRQSIDSEAKINIFYPDNQLGGYY